MHINDILKSKNYKKFYDHVVGWNATCRGGKHVFSQEVIDFQFTLIEEEYKEFIKALEEDDLVEALDGLCDIFVVSSYYDFLYFNMAPSKSNFLLPAWELLNPLPTIDYGLDLSYHVKTTNSPYFIVQSVMALLFLFNGNTTKAMEEVLRSNDTKIPTKADLEKYFPVTKKNLELECKRIEEASEGRYTGVTYKKVKDRYVFTSDLGKVLKPITFSPPDLTPYI